MRRYAPFLVILKLLCSFADAEAQNISNQNIRGAVENATPAGLTATWLSANFLVDGLSGATEASAVEMRDANGNNRATILILRTGCTNENPTGVYPHDYRRCGSIHTRYIANATPMVLRTGAFHLLESIKRDAHEFEISFIVQDAPTRYVVDSEMLSSLYGPKCEGLVFNFEVWSGDPSMTSAIVTSILARLSSLKTLIFQNSAAKTVPVTLTNVARFNGDAVEIVATAARPVQAEVTLVAWTAPNPVPAVTRQSLALNQGLNSFILPLGVSSTSPSEVEIQVREGGSFLDGVLVSSNHFGGYSSSWTPFSGLGSNASIRGVSGSASAAPSSAISLNDSVVELTCSLAASSFCGMFTDLLPERTNSLDLSDFELLSFQARSGAPTPQVLEVKLESKSGAQYSRSVTIGPDWNSTELTLSSFAPNDDWTRVGKNISRVTMAMSNPTAAPTPASAAIGFMSIRRKPLLSLTVLGDGVVSLASNGVTCTGVCSLRVERNRQVTLIASPRSGRRFAGWFGSEDCVDGIIVPSDDISCGAMFEDVAAAPQNTWQLYGTAAGGTVHFAVGPVPLDLQTLSGQTAAKVASMIADAINRSVALNTVGVTATARNSTIVINRNFGYTQVSDPGLYDVSPQRAHALPAFTDAIQELLD